MTAVDDVARERVRYFPRQLVGAEDLNTDQAYHRQKLREHNRYLHGWGVVCGCDVRPAASSDKPWQVRICPGYVMTPSGDGISIREEVLFDVTSCILQSADPCAFSRPCPPVTWRAVADQPVIHLAVRYVECQSRPVRVAPLGCSCEDTDCEYSRIRDGYEFCCLDEVPADHGSGCGSSSTGIVDCPACSDDGWVVLATITLPASRTAELTDVDPHRNRRNLRTGDPGGFTALEPARILDTRSGNGAPMARIPAQGTLELKVTGVGGVPAGGVSAVALNVTVVSPGAPGYLIVYPKGTTRPDTSTHNFVADHVANLVLIKVGKSGFVTLFNAGGEIDLVADIEGWFRQ